jgi:hypothetical protein
MTEFIKNLLIKTHEKQYATPQNNKNHTELCRNKTNFSIPVTPRKSVD